MAGKQQTFARNARELARYFYADMVDRPRIFKRQIGVCAEWTKDASFPKKSPKGWKLEEVKAWNAKRYSEAQAAVAAEQKAKQQEAELPGVQPEGADLEKLLDRYQDMTFRPEAYEDKIAVWQVRMLEKHRPHLFEGEKPACADGSGAASPPPSTFHLPPSTIEDTFRDGSGKLRPCESQKALAMRLAMVFAGRTSIDISEQQISRWKSDPASLPAGCPPPPPKIGNRFETQLWAEWFEKFMLPHYGYNTAQGVMKGLLAQAADARAQQEIDRGRITAIERENVERAHSEKWIELEDARQVFSAAIIALREEFRGLVERKTPLAIEQKAREAGWSDDLVMTVKGWALELGMTAVDTVDEFCASQETRATKAAKQKVNERLAENI